MVDNESLVELNNHLKNHLSDHVQTHESYQIQWESRLDNAVGRSRKKIWIAIVYVDFQIMRLKIEIDDELAWNIRWLNESVIFWDQSWISLDSRFVFNDSLRVEFSSTCWHSIILEKVSSSVDLERILTKDISPESFKDSSVDSTRHYFGPTRKIYVYSGTFKSIFHSHGWHAHLRGPTSKGSCMRKPVNRIP